MSDVCWLAVLSGLAWADPPSASAVPDVALDAEEGAAVRAPVTSAGNAELALPALAMLATVEGELAALAARPSPFPDLRRVLEDFAGVSSPAEPVLPVRPDRSRVVWEAPRRGEVVVGGLGELVLRDPAPGSLIELAPSDRDAVTWTTRVPEGAVGQVRVQGPGALPAGAWMLFVMGEPAAVGGVRFVVVDRAPASICSGLTEDESRESCRVFELVEQQRYTEAAAALPSSGEHRDALRWVVAIASVRGAP